MCGSITKYVMCLTLCKVLCLLASMSAANVQNVSFVVLPCSLLMATLKVNTSKMTNPLQQTAFLDTAKLKLYGFHRCLYFSGFRAETALVSSSHMNLKPLFISTILPFCIYVVATYFTPIFSCCLFLHTHCF